MSRCTILIYASLLSSLELFCYADETDGPFTSPTTVSSISIISPDRHDDHDNFGVADFQIDESEDSYRVNLRIENFRKQISKECSFDIPTRGEEPAAEVGGISLRRLSDSNRFVLTWYDETYDSEGNLYRSSNIIGMDLNNCLTYDLQLPELQKDPIVIPATGSGEFSVYIADSLHCQSERCVQKYNKNFEKINEPAAFDDALDWWTLQISHESGRTSYHGVDARGTYRVRVYGFANKVKELVRIPNASSETKVVTAGDAVCWVADASVDKTVTCSLFESPDQDDSWGQLIFTQKIKFNQTVTPLAVRIVNRSKLLLFVGDTSCTTDESCWNLKTTTVTSDSSTTVETKFDCTGDWKDFVLSSLDVNEYWYACRHGNRYLSGVHRYP